MKELLKWGGFTGVMALTVAWLGGVFQPKIAPAEVHETPKKVSGLKVETVKPQNLNIVARFAGTVIAQDTARISTRIAGFVEKIYVHIGDRVKKGQLLMVIDPKDLIARKESLLHQSLHRVGSDIKPGGNYSPTITRSGIEILDILQLPELVLYGFDNLFFNNRWRRPRILNDNVYHGDDDIGIFLFGGGHNGYKAEKERDYNQYSRQFVIYKSGRQFSRQTFTDSLHLPPSSNWL